MAESSDDEIIQRKRPNMRKKQYTSDSSMSVDILCDSDGNEGAFNPLFIEIFGNGDEYNYIYKDKELHIIDNTKITKEVDASACFEHISKYYRGFKTHFQDITQEIIGALLDGYTPQYLAFHTNKMNVNELYYTIDLIDNYTKQSTPPKHTLNIDPYTSTVVNNSKQEDLDVSGVLTISKYVQNLQNYECVEVPGEIINLPFALSSTEDTGWGNETPPFLGNCNNKLQTLTAYDTECLGKYFKKTILQISFDPIFIDRVIKTKTIEILEPETASSSLFSLEFLQKLYCSGNGGIDDVIRSFIIESAYKLVNLPKADIENPLLRSGLIEGPGGLEELVNIIVSLQGKPGSYAGVYYDLGLFSVVKIDDLGNIEKTIVYRDFQVQELQMFLQDVNNVILASSTPSVKYVIQNCDVNFLYLPKKISFFNDHKELSIPYNIAMAVQNPVLYFSRVLYSLKNNIPIHFSSEFNISDQLLLERAIITASSMRKIDWKNTLKHRFGYTIFSMLGINLTDRNLNIEHLNKLESLSQLFDQVKYANICTIFNLLDSENPLDKTFVHPNNYSTAAIICQGAYHKLVSDKADAIKGFENFNLIKDQTEIIAFIVSQPSLTRYFIAPMNISEKQRYDIMQTKSILLRSNEVTFAGATDFQIFEDVVPSLKINETYSGAVFKVGTDFCLCKVNDATVFVKKMGELSINQLVRVHIMGESYCMLSYEGTLVEREETVVDRFRTHQLFKSLDQEQIEEYMDRNRHSILIRPSATPSHCVVVCKLDQDIFYLIKIQEIYYNTRLYYQFNCIDYSSIDCFIESYITPIYLYVSKILSFKYFFRDQREAIEYLQTPGEYVKYCVLLSKEALGYLEFLILGKKFFVKLDGPKLTFTKYSFTSFEEMVSFFKLNNSKL